MAVAGNVDEEFIGTDCRECVQSAVLQTSSTQHAQSAKLCIPQIEVVLDSIASGITLMRKESSCQHMCGNYVNAKT